MSEKLLNKLKTVINNCTNPNAIDIDLKLDYDELVHLYSLEAGNLVYLNTLENQLLNSFDKIEKCV